MSAASCLTETGKGSEADGIPSIVTAHNGWCGGTLEGSDAKGTVMAEYTVNRAAVRRARDLIAAKQWVLDSEWGESQPDTDAQNAYLEGHDWTDYGSWFLGRTVGANPDTKGGHAFVFGDFRRIHRSGLIACVYRASEWHHKKVELAAHRLLQELDKAAGIG